jgi:hypothetical protein
MFIYYLLNHLPRTNHNEKNSHKLHINYDILNSSWITKPFLLWCETMGAKEKKKKNQKNYYKLK